MQLAILPDQAAQPSNATPSTAPIKFHISLNVRDLARSVGFYKSLFDREPAKQFADYAKFELENPPLVLSLEPQPHATGGSLNHLGFRVASADSLIDMQRRLESLGLPTTREDGVECCHAKQTKFWIADPDQNNWEIYILEDDIEHRGVAQAPQPARDPQPNEIRPIMWEHQLGTPFPQPIPHKSGSVDEVLLRGTFNEPLTDDVQAHIFTEVWRVLRAGARLTVHGLASDLPLSDEIQQLPGPASAVTYVPTVSWLTETLTEWRFSAVHILKLSQSAVFRQNGNAFRELLVEARKLERSPFAIQQAAIYRGPARSLTDDLGHVFLRGRRTLVTSDIAELLRTGPTAESFIFLPPDAD